MKKSLLLAAAFLGVFVCHAQQRNAPKMVRTEPNGVVVYEAQGVEVAEEAPVRPVEIAREAAPTLMDMSADELETRRYFVEAKLQKAKDDGEDAAQIEIYEEEKRLVLERIEAVKGQ